MPDYGYVQNVVDLGSLITNSLIKVNFVEQTFDGSLDLVTKISTSTDNVLFTNEVESTQLYATNFRYVRVRVEFGVVPNISGQPLGLLLSLTGA